MTTIERVCEACGGPIKTKPGSKGGRPRRWCSDACRQRASRARSGTQAATTAAVKGVEAEQAVELVLASPEATRQLLTKITETIKTDPDAVSNGVVGAVFGLHKAITDHMIRVNRVR